MAVSISLLFEANVIRRKLPWVLLQAFFIYERKGYSQRLNLWHSPPIFQENGYCFSATYSSPFQLSLYQSTIFSISIVGHFFVCTACLSKVGNLEDTEFSWSVFRADPSARRLGTTMWEAHYFPVTWHGATGEQLQNLFSVIAFGTIWNRVVGAQGKIPCGRKKTYAHSWAFCFAFQVIFTADSCSVSNLVSEQTAKPFFT